MVHRIREKPHILLENPSEKVGIVAFSFGLRATDEEPNPCNRRLAEETFRIATSLSFPVYIVSQWEITRALNELGMPPSLSVEMTPEKYLDSEGVMDVAATFFKSNGITSVIPIAHPFLHGTKCRRLVVEHGFKLIKRDIRKIGFDRKSLQPYTRGPLQLLLYAIRQKLFGHRGTK
ncbi:MAG: hypothetical protein Q7K40_04445 [bacterium]|nr:hypothetical protein [bacterium]